MTQVDANHDGDISFDEFSKAMMGMIASKGTEGQVKTSKSGAK